MDVLVRRNRVQCICALISCAIVVICVCIGVTMNLTTLYDEDFDNMGIRTFCMFTVNSNILAAISSFAIIPYAVDGIRKKEYSLPNWVVVASSVVLLASYGLYVEVMRENAYLSRTIEIQDGQTVVDTGLYSVVRHPMYSATVLLFLSIPLVLGSLISLLCFLPYVFIISLRIKDEEALLERELSGYSEYKKRVKYRLIPFIW